MAKRTTATSIDDFDSTLRAHITNRLAQVGLEQDRLREMLALLPANGGPPIPVVPLVPAPGPETLPTPRRRSWSPEAREAQRRRMKAHWRKQKAK